MISAIHGNVPNVATLDIQQCPVDKGKIIQPFPFKRYGVNVKTMWDIFQIL